MKKFFLALLIMATVQLSAEEALLQAEISVIPPTQKSSEHLGKILPGSQMKLVAVVKNTGKAPNTPGSIFLRYIYPEPLADQPNSLLFQTDSIKVPSIPPGLEISLTFPVTQNWPSLFDFIRNDWPMRQFQAVYVNDEKEYIIGNLSIVFSAYYYEGPMKEFPLEVPSAADQKKTDPTRAVSFKSRKFRKK